jgi:glycosyltransferase involved in cell wall biosynthesis
MATQSRRTTSQKSPRRSAVLVVTPPCADGSHERITRHLIDELAAENRFHFTWAVTEGAVTQGAAKEEATDDAVSVAAYRRGTIILPMQLATGFINRVCRGFGLPPLVKTKRPMRWNRRSLRQLRLAVQSVDCVWLHNINARESVAAFRLAQAMGKRVLVTQHGAPICEPRFFNRMTSNLTDRLFTRRRLRQADCASFTSDAVAEFYHSRVGFTSPVTIIPNGVDSRHFPLPAKTERQKLRKNFSLRDSQPVLLFAGSLTPENNLEVLRHLAKKLPDWRFWIAALDGFKSGATQNRALIEPEKWFLANVQVFRNRSAENLAELYQAADLLVLPGYGSGFPLAAQEAMACGLPVICSSMTTAQCRAAKPYLWTLKINPGSPQRTADLWAQKLKAGRDLLPLSESKKELTEAAQTLWEWPQIAGYYAELLQDLCGVSAALQ